jgi:hypothetical protein
MPLLAGITMRDDAKALPTRQPMSMMALYSRGTGAATKRDG